MDLTQLGEIKKQFEEVFIGFVALDNHKIHRSIGIESPYEFFCAVKAGPGEVQGLYRECSGADPRKSKYVIVYFELASTLIFLQTKLSLFL